MSLASQLRRSLDTALSERGLSADSGGPLFVRASGIGDCARKQTYRMLNPQTGPMDPYGSLQAIQGNWVEDGVRTSLLKMAGFWVANEQMELTLEEDGELVVVGHIDGLIREDTGVIETPWHLWECKAMSAYRYRKLVTKGDVRSGEPNYYEQAQLYMHMLQDFEVQSCLFTAFAKDPSALNAPRNGTWLDPIYVEEIAYEPSQGQRLVQRAKGLLTLAKAGQLGPRERNPWKDWDCSQRFCPFYDHCDPKSAIRRAA